MDDWPAKEKWTFGYFKNLAKEMQVRIEIGNVLHDRPQIERLGLTEYIELIEGAEAARSEDATLKDAEGVPYLAYFDIFKYFPGLKTDVEFSFWKGRFRFPIAWIGPAGTFTGLHWDVGHNLFAQFCGKKEFTLYPPESTPYLYTSKKYDIGSILSQVDSRRPDFQRFPLFKKAEGTKVIVEAGQILYTPRGWWHQVLALKASISVSCFAFGLKDGIMHALPGLAMHALHLGGLYRKSNCACHPD